MKIRIEMKKEENNIGIFLSLISHRENEVVEFKSAEKSFDFNDLGEYFSALSNEANLRGLDFAWLIFGYDEKKMSLLALPTRMERVHSIISNMIFPNTQPTVRLSARLFRLKLNINACLCSKFRPHLAIS